jgi:hypothetical protein
VTTQGPVDPITDLAQAANSLHELFTEYMRAGFRRSEALELIREQIRAAASSPTTPGGDQ